MEDRKLSVDTLTMKNIQYSLSFANYQNDDKSGI